MIADGYIFVFQDIRGRFKSEGQFVMQRDPCATKTDPKAIDESTDTYDTIDWLLKNVPHNNGRVGMLGISYGGWLTTMALLDPHPALKAASEQASPADMFLGDDFHHNGAFRLSYGFEYAALMETAENQLRISIRPLRHLRVVSAPGRALQRQREIFSRQAAHLERFRRPSELRRLLEEAGVRAVPRDEATGAQSECGGLVGSGRFLRPDEDLRTVRKERSRSSELSGGGPVESRRLGATATGKSSGDIAFGSDTCKYFREKIEAPWFAYWLKDKGKLAAQKRWSFRPARTIGMQYDSWPPQDGATRETLFPRRRQALVRCAASCDAGKPSTATSPIPRIRFRTAIARSSPTYPGQPAAGPPGWWRISASWIIAPTC